LKETHIIDASLDILPSAATAAPIIMRMLVAVIPIHELLTTNLTEVFHLHKINETKYIMNQEL
jgi:hypothetical protein